MRKAISIFLISAMLLAGMGIAIAQQVTGGAKLVDIQNNTNVKIPPAPLKPKPNLQYGNNERAAIIGERLSSAAQGNARVYITEDSNIMASVYLYQDANPYDMIGTMANLTYMLSDLYSLTDRADSNIVVKVYDTSKNPIMDAMFDGSKNAFAYFKVSASAQAPQPSPTSQPGRGRVPTR